MGVNQASNGGFCHLQKVHDNFPENMMKVIFSVLKSRRETRRREEVNTDKHCYVRTVKRVYLTSLLLFN